MRGAAPAATLLAASLAVAPGAFGGPLFGTLDGRLVLSSSVATHEPERVLVALPPAGQWSTPGGLLLRSCLGEVCTALLVDPAAALDPLGAGAWMEPSSRRRPLLDSSLPAAGVPESWRDLGADGEGAVVAVIDSGVDFRHPELRDDDGGSRILYLVDLSEEPTGLHPELEERLGAALWDRADIDAHLAAEDAGLHPVEPVRHRDTHGHGTHVTAVAAGRRGVAPEAGIIAVRASRQDWPVVFEDADVLEAARLVFDLAEALDRPCVLLLALGGHQGGHDGASLLELGLADLVGGDDGDRPGRAIVVAAGNSGHCQDHAGGMLAGSGQEELVALDVLGEDASLAVDVELWYGAGAELSVGLETPEGRRVEPLPAGHEQWTNTSAARIGVVNAPGGASPVSGDFQAVVSLRGQLQGPVEPGRYHVVVRGSGRFDAYLAWTSDAIGERGASLSSHLEPDGSLTVPATSEALIVVGASVSRASWTDEAGRQWGDDRFRPGRLASYSGSGPTRVGAMKPDLVAPGHSVVAALGRDGEPPSEASVFTPAGSFLPDRYRVVAPGDRAALSGTSVAAPHVAGVAAVLFGRDPSLDQRGIRSLLVASARSDREARGRGWSPRWGFGELDGAGALSLLEEGFGSDPAAPETSSVGLSADVVRPEECVEVTLVPRDALGLPLGPGHNVEVVADMGETSSTRDLDDGVYAARWCARGTAGGDGVVIEGRVDGVVASSAEVLVAPDRRHLGAWATAGGGCEAAAAGNGSSRRGGLLEVLGALLLR